MQSFPTRRESCDHLIEIGKGVAVYRQRAHTVVAVIMAELQTFHERSGPIWRNADPAQLPDLGDGSEVKIIERPVSVGFPDWDDQTEPFVVTDGLDRRTCSPSQFFVAR